MFRVLNIWLIKDKPMYFNKTRVTKGVGYVVQLGAAFYRPYRGAGGYSGIVQL